MNSTIRLKILPKYRLTMPTADTMTFHSNLVMIKHNVLIITMNAPEEPVFQIGVSWAMSDRGLASCISPPPPQKKNTKKIISKATNYDKSSSCCRGWKRYTLTDCRLTRLSAPLCGRRGN
jgi:hypothetical protein